MRILRSVFPIVSILVLCTTQLYGAITGTISGVVSDPTGAAMPGVTVTATDQLTGVANTVVTDSKGFYSFPALAVGIYTVNVRQSGFRDFSEQGIRIDANSSIRTDIQLLLGAVTETETVNADAVQVETQNTQLGEVIDSAKMTAVPLDGRAFTDLLALQPGVSPYKASSEGGGDDSRPVSGGLNTGNQSVNGGRESSNGFMINGADANEGVSNGAAIIPNLDSIAQFRIITNNFDPEYGNFSGGQINVVTKSGTNSYHGNVFNFLRNTDLDARNFYAPSRGVYIQNIFGGTLGGPIKKNKLFFFGDFQGTKQTQGQTQNFPVPSDSNRAGDLSSFFGDSTQYSGQTVQGTSWANSLTQRLGYTVNANEPYYAAGCSSTADCVFPNGQIPVSAWDPTAANLLQFIPRQTNTGLGTFSTSAYSQKLTDYKGSIRVDTTSRFGTLFGYYFIDDFDLTTPYYSGINVPGFDSQSKGRAQMVNVGLTSTFKNNAVNDFRFAYMRDVNLLGLPQGGVGPSLSSLGFVSPWGPTGGIGPINPAYEGVPNMNFNSFQFGVPADTLNQFNNVFQWLDSYTKIVGEHTLKFGIDYHYDQINERNYYGENGSFTFSGQETGSDFADFLLGAPANFIQASKQILDSRSQYFGAYGQDSWRVTPNLTLNFGLRYEISTPWYDTQNKLETIIPGVQSVVFPGAPQGYLVPGDPGVARTLAPIRWNNFGPRFGFAFAPSGDDWFTHMMGGPGKSSIRGGFGIAYTNIQDATGFLEVGDAPFGLFYSSPVPSLMNAPFIDRATGNNEGQRFPFTFPSTNVSAKNPDTTFDWASVLPISGSLVYDVHNVLPYVQSFYLGVQRELTSSTVMSLNYVGNLGRKLLTLEESNPGDPALCLKLMDPTLLAPGQSTCGPGLESNTFTLADGTVVEGTRTTLGIDFASNPYMKTIGSSNYHSFQATLQHSNKYADFLIGYTYGRSFDNSSAHNELTNVFNPELSRAISSFDVHQNFVASYTVPLPFDGYTPRPGLLHQVIGGWELSGITTFATGLPVTISENDDNSLTGSQADLPNYDPHAGPLFINKNPRSGQMYFNTNVFSQEELGRFGNSQRRFFYGPGLNNTDLALLKTFKFKEDVNLQFRAEAFNVFNHTQFQGPSGNFNNTGQGGFGYVTSANDPRIMQIALKLYF